MWDHLRGIADGVSAERVAAAAAAAGDDSDVELVEPKEEPLHVVPLAVRLVFTNTRLPPQVAASAPPSAKHFTSSHPRLRRTPMCLHPRYPQACTQECAHCASQEQFSVSRAQQAREDVPWLSGRGAAAASGPLEIAVARTLPALLFAFFLAPGRVGWCLSRARGGG